ncbi:DUF3902 family protein [Bacillus infantis]|uniref:DUF3902 family protein n=1 Tax=Bacillus infantis TaxID=324767 RepID=UPI003CEE382C
MSKLKSIAVSLITAGIGFAFSLNIQTMAYWGEDGSLTMGWYLFTFVSMMLIRFSFKEFPSNVIYIVLLIVNVLLLIATLLCTTFIIIAWQSGF